VTTKSPSIFNKGKSRHAKEAQATAESLIVNIGNPLDGFIDE
jgi:hypothetical protein